jgi:hypothetical protein
LFLHVCFVILNSQKKDISPLLVHIFCLDPICKNLDYFVVILFHCIGAEMASQSEDDSAVPSVQIVGNTFVNQYYTVLHQTPKEVYRFYNDSSVLTRPGPDGVMTSVTTVDVSFVKYKLNCLIDVVPTRVAPTRVAHFPHLQKQQYLPEGAHRCYLLPQMHVHNIACTGSRCLSY